MEVIDIGLSDLEPISIQIDDKPSTSVIGSGIELLMNDKRRNVGQTSVSMDDLDKLENELNDLSSRSSVPHSSAAAASGASGVSNGFGLFDSTSKTLSGLGNMFGLGGGSGAKETSKADDGYEHSSSSSTRLGSATAESVGNNRTWDGFTKLQDIPDNKYEEAPSAAKLSEREKRRKKRLMLKKLEE